MEKAIVLCERCKDRPQAIDGEVAEAISELQAVGICIDLETVHKAIDKALALLERKTK